MLASTAASAAIGAWQPIYTGVWYATGTKSTPQVMKAYALRVDLTNNDIGITATPSNGGGALETNLQTTPSFISTYNLKAGINANFYSPSGGTADVRGCLVWAGNVVSLHESAFPTQLRITAAKVATIVSATQTPTTMHTVVSGDAYHLINGTRLGATSPPDSRTSVGLSQDRRFLYMVVVDQGGGSQGATIRDMSDWMADFGANDAMNLDGGGSSTICTAAAGVLNVPSDGSPRSVGANFGVQSTSYNPRMDCWVRASSDGNIKKRYWTQANEWNGVWNDYGQPPGGAASAPTAVSQGPDLVDLFVFGNDNLVYKRSYNGSAWSGWASIGTNGGFTLVGRPSVGSWGPGRLDVVVRSSANQLLRRYSTNGGTSWTAWSNEGVTITDNPAIACWETGRIDIFARNSAGSFAHRYYDGAWHNATRAGAPLGGLAAVSASKGAVHVFYRGSDVSMKWRSYKSDGTWSGETNLGGTFYTDPGAASYQAGHLAVFGQALFGVVHVNNYSGSWSGWTVAGNTGTTTDPIAGSSWSNDAGTH